MKTALFLGAAAAVLLSAVSAQAQHAGHQMPMPAQASQTGSPRASTGQPPASVDPHAGHDMSGMRMDPPQADPHAGHDMAGMDGMAMRGFYGPYPMNREASGTAWQPEAASEMGGLHAMSGEWMWMGHALLNGVFTEQGGPRGDSMAFASGMIMGMGQRALGGGTLGVRVMVSPDPLMGRRGYPLLLAAGETADGVTPLIDRQHPHELLDELAATYSYPLGMRSSVFGYVAAVGEPAFGPPAFMHRSSGMDNPLAPISHHWLDSTHVSFGVLTGGVVLGDVKLEASGFRGREPDQNRYDLESPRLDSWTARATWNPSPEWSLQVSRAHQRSPEQLEPDEDVTRTSASVAYGRRFSGGMLNATVAWGRRQPSEGEALDAVLAEAALSWDSGWSAFARAERIETNELLGGGHHDPVYRVGELTVGGIYDWTLRPGVRLGVGAAMQAYDVPGALRPLYGDRPTGVAAFVRLRAM